MAVPNPAIPMPVIPPEFQREMDMLKAQVKFPLADEAIMKMVQGTSEEIMAAAEKLHKQALALATPPAAVPAQPAPVTAQPPAPAPAQPQPTPPPAPGPAPVPSPTQAVPPVTDPALEARYLELKNKVDYGIAEPHERLEFFNSALRNSWNEHVGKMAERRH